jgi:O-antigen ligase
MGLEPEALLVIVGALGVAALAGVWASPLVFFAIVAALGIALFLVAPALGLVAVPALAFFAPVDFPVSTMVRVNAAVLAVPGLVVLWGLGMARQRRFSFVRTPLNPAMVVFLAVITLAWVVGYLRWDPFVPKPANVLQVQFGQWAIYAFSLAAMWLGANLLVEERWLRWTTYSFLAAGSIAIFIRMLPDALNERLIAGGSMTSLFGVWFAAMALSQLLFNRRLPAPARFLLVAALLILFYLFFVLAMRWLSGWVPVLIVIFVLLALRFPRLALLLVVIGAVVIWLNLDKVITGLQLDRELARSGGGRLAHWRIVWEFVRERPWFGLGLAAYRHYAWSRPELVANLFYRGANVSTHNNYYDIFAFAGVVGLAAFLWLAVVFGRVAWRVARRLRGAAGFDFDVAYAHGVLAGFSGLLVSGLLGDWFLPFVYNIGFPGFRASVMGWVLMGGLAALATQLGGEGRPIQP